MFNTSTQRTSLLHWTRYSYYTFQVSQQTFSCLFLISQGSMLSIYSLNITKKRKRLLNVCDNYVKYHKTNSAQAKVTLKYSKLQWLILLNISMGVCTMLRFKHHLCFRTCRLNMACLLNYKARLLLECLVEGHPVLPKMSSLQGKLIYFQMTQTLDEMSSANNGGPGWQVQAGSSPVASQGHF